MAGLQSLMQRGQMPGQAGSFSALPTQQGRSPQSYTASLKQLPPEELIRIYQDPNDLRPKWAVASAYADSMKAKALQQGVQGQQAMAQNAAEQQQPPVADALMARMAASGGEMHGYAGGGAIGFSGAGSLDAYTILQRLSEEVRKAEQASVAADQALQRYGSVQRQQNPQGFESAKQSAAQAQKALDDARKAYRAGPTMTAGVQQARPAPEPVVAAETKPAARPPEEAGTSAAPSNAGLSVKPVSEEAPPQNIIRQQVPESGLAALSNDFEGFKTRIESAGEKAQKAIAERGKTTPEMEKAREMVSQARATQLQQGEEDIRKVREGGVREAQSRLTQARKPIIEDAEALLSIAGGIVPKRGQVLSSLATAASSTIANKRIRAEKAEESVSALVEKMRLLNAQQQEARALEEQRKYAILTNDVDAKRNADLESARVELEISKLLPAIQANLIEANAKMRTAGVQASSNAIANEANTLAKLQLTTKDKEKAIETVERANAEKYKATYAIASLPSATPEAKAAAQAAKAELNEAVDRINKSFDPGINQLRSATGIPAIAASKGLEGWGKDVKITEPPKK